MAFSNLSRDAKKGLTAKPRIDALRALLELPGTEGTGPDDEPLVNFLARYTTVGFAAADRLQRGQAFDASVVAAAADRVAHLQQQLRACALREVILTARAQAQQEKIRRGVLSADDVLNRTLAALTGAQGAAFARRLRQRFPVAMIDEFQDTDPVQWQIFARVYDTASSDAFACVLIGDPKQAIYGFRGADVFSYLDARQIIGAPRLHRLNVTRRASARLANGLNALYWNAERSPFLLNGIDYLPIASAITNENAGFSRDGVDLPPLIFWHLDLQHRDAVGKGDMVEAMADVAAARIEAMLKGPYRVDGVALVPGDIAVLVRDRTEAGPMRRALARRRRDAAYLDRSGVFAGEAAQLVRLLLLALADPNDDARVRAVLASHLGGWSIARLAESLTDDDAWQQETERFHELAAVAAARGVLAMLRAAIARFDLAPRWLNTANGARLLTDWRHVGELLQIEAARLGGGARLIRWLERRMAAASSDEAHLMRLESDEDLIKIVTLHGAKGLEYPVVLLPFVCAARRNTGGIYHTLVDEADTGSRDAGAAQQSARRPADPLAAPRHRAVWDLRAEPHAEIDQERLAEDLRLLYVGLTRARRACFVGVANSDREPVSYSALGRLLLGDDTGAGDAQLQAALAKLSAACPDIAVESVTAEAVAPATAAVAVDAPVSADAPPFEDPRGSTLTADDTPAARTFTGRIDASWRITSYSSLTRAASAEYTAPGADDEDAGEHTAVVDAEAAIQYQFPRGAAAGVVLHKLLERWPSDDPLPFVTTELRNAGLLYGRKSLGESARDELRARAVVAWLNTVRAVKLAPLNVALRDLTRVRAELEFQLPLANVPTRQLWRVLATHGYRGDALPAQQLNGMLRGFIDLVFEHQGRYFIVDYKSNFLGGQAQAYSARHLAAAMRNHRYDLQFLLYALALRRWLAVHGKPNVTPGVFYVFLRGIAAPGAGIYHHVPSAAVLDDLDTLFNGATA